MQQLKEKNKQKEVMVAIKIVRTDRYSNINFTKIDELKLNTQGVVNGVLVVLSTEHKPQIGDISVDTTGELCVISDIFEDGFNVIELNYHNSTKNTYWLPKHKYEGVVVAISDNNFISVQDERIPVLSKQFVKKYINMFNNGNQIEAANLKYYQRPDEISWRIFTDDNNTITVLPLQKNYNRNEIIELFNQYEYEMNNHGVVATPVDWIKNHFRNN